LLVMPGLSFKKNCLQTPDRNDLIGILQGDQAVIHTDNTSAATFEARQVGQVTKRSGIIGPWIGLFFDSNRMTEVSGLDQEVDLSAIPVTVKIEQRLQYVPLCRLMYMTQIHFGYYKTRFFNSRFETRNQADKEDFF